MASVAPTLVALGLHYVGSPVDFLFACKCHMKSFPASMGLGLLLTPAPPELGGIGHKGQGDINSGNNQNDLVTAFAHTVHLSPPDLGGLREVSDLPKVTLLW